MTEKKTSTVRSKSFKRVDLNGIYEYCAINQSEGVNCRLLQVSVYSKLALN